MKNTKVIQHFHSVGNGTFKTGSIFNWRDGKQFNWVYDCGSTSPSTLNRIFRDITMHKGWPGYIDMLVLSHFDDDHVNGVETLLKHNHVKSLVLPFSEWAQSVREISVLGKKGVSSSTALLQLNPLQWLASRDFDVQVDEVVLVQGGSDRPSPVSDNFPKDDDPGAFSENYFTFNQRSMPGRTTIKTVQHNHPIYSHKSDLEFVFYNAEKDFKELGLIVKKGGQWCAKKSGRPLTDVKADIQNTIESISLHIPSSTMPLGWRKTLKSCYEKHFGQTGKAKNNISLCMYTAPTRNNVSDFLVIRNSQAQNYPFHPTHLFYPRYPLFSTSRLATLCTGDITLTSSVIADLKSHLGLQRWDKIGLIQVPHHGSQHSWKSGNAGLLAPAQFLHCASGSKHHPHPKVMKDLIGFVVHTADRTNGVSIDYNI